MKYEFRLDVQDKWGKTALHKAAAHGNNEGVSMLMAAGADCNTQDSFGNTPLHAAIRNGNILRSKSSTDSNLWHSQLLKY